MTRDVLGEEILHFRGPFVGFLERRNALRCDQEQCAQGRVVHVWGLAFSHFHQHNTEGPNVNLSFNVISDVLQFTNDNRCLP